MNIPNINKRKRDKAAKDKTRRDGNAELGVKLVEKMSKQSRFQSRNG